MFVLNLIVAVDKNWGIGKDNRLLVSIPQDMKFFRETTSDSVVIMGRKTLESLPGGKPLQKRINIVISSDMDYVVTGAVVVHSINQAIAEAKKYKNKKVFVIGGASIYRQMLPYCDFAYVSKIEHEFDADTYFPNLDEMGNWEIESESEEYMFKDIGFRFVKYKNNSSNLTN